MDLASNLLAEAADPARAPGMQAYMKDVAPFLGVSAPDRRRNAREIKRQVPTPCSGEVVEAAESLIRLPHREFHYLAIDLSGLFRRQIDESATLPLAELLITTNPWWDTVDATGSALVTPHVAGHPDAVEEMWRWSRSGDMWLARAAIQHQRGRGASTDVPRLLSMCAEHSADKRFWIAKAIGWALRDLSRTDPESVAGFMAEHPELAGVARREAERGVARASSTKEDERSGGD